MNEIPHPKLSKYLFVTKKDSNKRKSARKKRFEKFFFLREKTLFYSFFDFYRVSQYKKVPPFVGSTSFLFLQTFCKYNQIIQLFTA